MFHVLQDNVLVSEDDKCLREHISITRSSEKDVSTGIVISIGPDAKDIPTKNPVVFNKKDALYIYISGKRCCIINKKCILGYYSENTG